MTSLCSCTNEMATCSMPNLQICRPTSTSCNVSCKVTSCRPVNCHNRENMKTTYQSAYCDIPTSGFIRCETMPIIQTKSAYTVTCIPQTPCGTCQPCQPCLPAPCPSGYTTNCSNAGIMIQNNADNCNNPCIPFMT